MTRSLLILPALLGTVLPGAAQIEDLAALKSSRERIDRVSESLQQIRSRFLARKDSLSYLVDSLRGLDPASTGLWRLQLQSRQLLHRLLHVEARLDSAAADMDSLDQELRTAYDWEISRLIRLLEDEGWDDGLYRQLEVFQDERKELGNAAGPGHYRLDDEHELALNEQDGPGEIRQKVELAQYMATRARKDGHDISHRLECIEQQLLLLQQLDRVDGGEGPRRRRPGPARPLVVDSPSPDPVPPPPAEAPLLLEARRLKARQQELREVMAFLQERIDAFGERLAQILGGAE